MDVPEGAVQRALEALDVGGVVFADGDAPLGPARPRPLDVEVGRVEDDAARARLGVRLVEQPPVEGRDPVGVVALEPRRVVGRVLRDGPRRDERHARHRDRLLRDVRERHDPGRGDQPQPPRGGGAGHLVDDPQQHRRVVVAGDDHGGGHLREPPQRAHPELQRLVRRARGVEEVAGVQDEVGAGRLGHLQQPAEGREVVGGAVVPAELRPEVPVGRVEQLHGWTSGPVGRGQAEKACGVAARGRVTGRPRRWWAGAGRARRAALFRGGRVTGRPRGRSARPGCSGCGRSSSGLGPRRPPPRRGWSRTAGTGSAPGWARARWAARRPSCRA